MDWTDGDTESDSTCLIEDHIVTARKEHKCGECKNIIPKGQDYITNTIKYEDAITRGICCVPCATLAENIGYNIWLGQMNLWRDIENRGLDDLDKLNTVIKAHLPLFIKYNNTRAQRWYDWANEKKQWNDEIGV